MESPLVVMSRCVDSTPISFVPEFELGLEEVLVLPVVSIDEEVDQVDGSWEESCFLVFNNFLGFSIKGYEGEILDLMNSIYEIRDKTKGKGFNVELSLKESSKNWNGMCNKRVSGEGPTIGARGFLTVE